MKALKLLFFLAAVYGTILFCSTPFVACTKTNTVHDSTTVIVRDTVVIRDTIVIK
jgi:hypothetical protein